MWKNLDITALTQTRMKTSIFNELTKHYAAYIGHQKEKITAWNWWNETNDCLAFCVSRKEVLFAKCVRCGILREILR
jgi:hypothetical protein